MTLQTATALTGNTSDADYHACLERVRQRFEEVARLGDPLFTTDVQDLYAIYLSQFSAEQRAYHTCHACEAFISTFGED